MQQEGVFLVRKSTQGGSTDPYTLMFHDGNKVHNLHIRRRADNKYALGKEKDNEMVNPSLLFTTEKFVTSFIIGGSRGSQRRRTPCPKFLHFHAVFGKNWPNNRLANPLRDWPPLQEILDLLLLTQPNQGRNLPLIN